MAKESKNNYTGRKNLPYSLVDPHKSKSSPIEQSLSSGPKEDDFVPFTPETIANGTAGLKKLVANFNQANSSEDDLEGAITGTYDAVGDETTTTIPDLRKVPKSYSELPFELMLKLYASSRLSGEDSQIEFNIPDGDKIAHLLYKGKIAFLSQTLEPVNYKPFMADLEQKVQQRNQTCRNK